MSRALLSGATGLIGTHLSKALLDAGWEVHGVSRSAPAAGVIHHPIDLGREHQLSALPSNVDAVIHLAQSENYRDFPAAAESMVRVNTLSAVALLDYARRAGARSFLLASSGGLYGTGPRAFTEDDPILAGGELGFYLKTRAAAESFAASYQAYFSLVVMRFFFVYGAGQRASMLIPRLVRSVREGTPITLDGPDGLRLNPTHVEDVVRWGIGALGLSGSQTINAAGSEVQSLRTIGEAIGRAVGKAPVFSSAGAAPASPSKDLIGDIAKISALLGAPKVGFEDGIRRSL